MNTHFRFPAISFFQLSPYNLYPLVFWLDIAGFIIRLVQAYC
jgi:hypothetical protein